MTPEDIIPCPWDIRPQTIEEVAASLRAKHEWERQNERSCPRAWAPYVTDGWALDITERLLALEAATTQEN